MFPTKANPPTLYQWFRKPGTDVLSTANTLITDVVELVDESAWFDALEMGVFAEEYKRLETLAKANLATMT